MTYSGVSDRSTSRLGGDGAKWFSLEWRVPSRDGRLSTVSVTLGCCPLGLTSAAHICSAAAQCAGDTGTHIKMLSLPSYASSPIGEAIGVQQIKSCRTGCDRVPCRGFQNEVGWVRRGRARRSREREASGDREGQLAREEGWGPGLQADRCLSPGPQ